MNMDDDSDNEDDVPPRRPAAATPATSPSKHAALAAAVSPRNIAAPQPGYAAPITALNLARPEPVATPQGRRQPEPQFNPGNIQNPFENPVPSPYTRLPGSPSPSMMSSEPHPLQAPMTPITPVFARPAKPGVKFTEAAARPRVKPIMRGNSEETLLPNRGEKGDDFWRRFSMVAKEENMKPNAQKQRYECFYSLPEPRLSMFVIIIVHGSGKLRTEKPVSLAGSGLLASSFLPCVQCFVFKDSRH